MTRLVSSAMLAALAVSATLTPASIQARTGASFYTVGLAQPASDDEVIAGGVLFRCEGTTCTAPRSRDRDLRVCSELRREVGTIASFNAGGTMLSDQHLARCNG
ncbi:CC_3452 family protein [Aurantiacibacter odishensis]|uniref:CC_3452 family protein n=1 Tax=Aurantiacibacter odishensis TaxID=1155476 RepID=UPI0013C3F022|nr:hypothetical protein [Aurantiacibacter odishensis]